MIEVHVFNAFIQPSLKETAWYGVLNFFNGLVAPAFLFVAGMVFVVSSERKLESFRKYGTVFRKQLGRIVLIAVIGYGLHLPFFSLGRTLGGTTGNAWLKFAQVDILQCIAVGLLVMFAGRLILVERRAFGLFLWVMTAVMVMGAPFLWNIDFTRYLVPGMAAYLNGQQYSLFPLFPWLGFMLAGGLIGIGYLHSAEQGTERRFVMRTVWLGGVLIAAFAMIELPIAVPYASTAIRSNPLFVALRLGIVLMLLSGCWWYARHRSEGGSVVLDVSRETLLVYVAHLLVIYGTFWNDRSLVNLFGRSLSVVECMAATAILGAVMIAGAKVWGRFKSSSQAQARYVAFAGAFIVILAFLVR